MARLVQAADWSATSLGPRDTWSPSLKLAVDIILAIRLCLHLRCGCRADFHGPLRAVSDLTFRVWVKMTSSPARIPRYRGKDLDHPPSV
jgi:hypothetical protein